MKKIAILGPESTGKSVLAKKLAKHFGGEIVPEMSRLYLKDIQLSYSMDDILNIAKMQMETETSVSSIESNEDKLIFCDTEWITIKIWLEYYHYSVPNWLIEGIEQSEYVHYLLTNNDIPWVADPLRQNEMDRDEIFEQYELQLQKYKKEYNIVRGRGLTRIKNAANIILDL